MAKSERQKRNEKVISFQTHLIPTVQTHLILVLLTFIPQSFFILIKIIFNGEQTILPTYYRDPLNPHILPSTIFLAKYPNESECKSSEKNHHKRAFLFTKTH